MSIAIAVSWAIASASEISLSSQVVGSARCSASTPITRPNETIGVASTARTPRSASSRTWPRVESISSGASRTSPTASVRCSRAARFIDRQARQVIEGRDARRDPLRGQRRLLAGLAEADEAAVGADSLRGLLDGDAEQLVEVAQRPHRPGDVGDQPFALQRLGELGGRSRARERETRLRHERLHLRQLVVPEQARTADGREDDAHDLTAARASARKRSSSCAQAGSAAG